MSSILMFLQIVSGLITAFFILIHEPKAEGLGAIGASAHTFKGVRTSADERLDKITCFFAGIFLLCSTLLGLGLVK